MESILSPMMFFNIKVGNNRERTKQKSTFLYVKHKFLFEAPKKHLSPRSVANGKKQQRFFLWHTICKAKSKRNQIKQKKSD